MKLSDEESIIQLLIESEMVIGLDKMSESELDEVLHDVNRSVHDARELFKDVIEALVEIITELMEAEDIVDSCVRLPELNDRILSYNAFQLLATFFNGTAERNAREFNDIQSILVFAYALFKYRRHPLMKQAIKEHGPFTEKLTSEPFFARSKEPAFSNVYSYKEGRYFRIGKREEEAGEIEITQKDGTKKKN